MGSQFRGEEMDQNDNEKNGDGDGEDEGQILPPAQINPFMQVEICVVSGA